MHFSELDDRITPGCLVKVIPVRPQAMSKKFRDLLHISHTKGDENSTTSSTELEKSY